MVLVDHTFGYNTGYNTIKLLNWWVICKQVEFMWAAGSRPELTEALNLQIVNSLLPLFTYAATTWLCDHPFDQPTILHKLTNCVHVQQITKLLIVDLIFDLLAPDSCLWSVCSYWEYNMCNVTVGFTAIYITSYAFTQVWFAICFICIKWHGCIYSKQT